MSNQCYLSVLFVYVNTTHSAKAKECMNDITTFLLALLFGIIF